MSNHNTHSSEPENKTEEHKPAILSIAVATYGPEGMERLAKAELPRLEGLRYVVSWQKSRNTPVPQSLRRDDIDVYRFEEYGQSANRNNAYAHCQTEWIMVGDDDFVYHTAGIKALMHFIADHPEADFITYRSETDLGTVYPDETAVLHWPLPKGYFVWSGELTFKKSTGLQCCPELGLNSPRMHGGEDEALLMSAIKRGLHAVFTPILIVSHPHPSTGSKKGRTAANLRALGCIIALGWPATAPARVLLKAWRTWRTGKAPFWKSLFFMAQGMLEAPGVLKRNHNSLW